MQRKLVTLSTLAQAPNEQRNVLVARGGGKNTKAAPGVRSA